MYFTPPSIANRLMEDLENEGAQFANHTFMDPACGGAAFLALVASRVRTALQEKGLSPDAILQHVEGHIAGADADPIMCELARHFLRMVFYAEICAVGRAPKLHIVRADSLKAGIRLRKQYDVVVCNPPFRKLSTKDASRFHPDYSQVMQGQPNLYSLFMQLSVRLSRANGIVGLVTPTSFLSGQYFGSVRTFLLEQAKIRHIGIVRDRERVYLDVQQETALTVLRATKSPDKRLLSAAVSVIERNGEYKQIGRCNLPNSGTSWPLPRDPHDITIVKKLAQSPFRLSHYGYKPVVGNFVWNRDIRPIYLTQAHVPRTKRGTAIPLLWASDVKISGRLNFKKSTASLNQHRYIDYEDPEHPSIRRSPAVVLQRVTSNSQPRRLIGAVVSAQFLLEHRGFVGENHVVIVEQTSPSAQLPPQQLLALLKVPEIDRYFRCISGSANVSVFELEQLPLPDPRELRIKIEAGMSLQKAAQKLLTGL